MDKGIVFSIKDKDSSFVGAIEKEGQNYVIEYEGILSVRTHDVLVFSKRGEEVFLKLLEMQRFSNPKRYGQCTRIIAAPYLFERKPVTVMADVAVDGDKYLLKLHEDISVDSMTLKMNPVELIATKIEGDK